MKKVGFKSCILKKHISEKAAPNQNQQGMQGMDEQIMKLMTQNMNLAQRIDDLESENRLLKQNN